MARIDRRGPWYWVRGTDGKGRWITYAGQAYRPPGEELAALRRGARREAGSVPEMWPFYVSVVEEEHLTGRDRGWQPPVTLQAEHHALTLFGVHQQSQPQPMHVEDVGVGTAILALRQSGRFSEDAVDRRFAQAATATSLAELAHHLRGLVTQLRSSGSAQALDYTRLVEDLRDWCWPQTQHRVRRRWGGQYHRWARRKSDDEAESTTAAADD